MEDVIDICTFNSDHFILKLTFRMWRGGDELETAQDIHPISLTSPWMQNILSAQSFARLPLRYRSPAENTRLISLSTKHSETWAEFPSLHEVMAEIPNATFPSFCQSGSTAAFQRALSLKGLNIMRLTWDSLPSFMALQGPQMESSRLCTSCHRRVWEQYEPPLGL